MALQQAMEERDLNQLEASLKEGELLGIKAKHNPIIRQAEARVAEISRCSAMLKGALEFVDEKMLADSIACADQLNFVSPLLERAKENVRVLQELKTVTAAADLPAMREALLVTSIIFLSIYFSFFLL